MTTAHTAVMCQHATLSTTTADTVALSGVGSTFAIVNHHATEKLWFTINGVTAVAEADENYVVLPVQTVTLRVSGKPPKVSLVGNGNVYSVELY